MSDKPNYPGLSGYSKVVSYKEEISYFRHQVVSNNEDGFQSKAVGLHSSIATLVVEDSSEHDSVFTQKLALPLGEITERLGHDCLQLDSLLVGDQHPEMPAEEVLQQPALWGVVVMPSSGVTSDNIPEGDVYLGWAARLLASPVLALPRWFRVITQKHIALKIRRT